MCSTQIPVRLAISASVKIFWLDLTVIMALLLKSLRLYFFLPALMLASYYALHLRKSNSRSVLHGQNQPASTSAQNPINPLIFLLFSGTPCFCLWEGGGNQIGKKCLLL